MQAAAIPAPCGERFIISEKGSRVNPLFEPLIKALEEIVPGSEATSSVNSIDRNSVMFRIMKDDTKLQVVVSSLFPPHDTCGFVSNPVSQEDKFAIIHAGALKKAGLEVVMLRSSSLGCPVLSVPGRMIRVEYREIKTPASK